MKILIRTLPERVKRFSDLVSLPADWELVWAGFERDTDKLLEMAGDADAIFVDAMEPAPGELIRQMPNLKLIHSEGVGFEKIDLEAASERGIYVCNNRSANAKAVAEQAIMLMLAVLRRTVEGDRMVREARQIEAKSSWSLEGIRELWSLKAGLIGMGSIGKETAKRLRAFDTQVYYYNRTRLPEAEEQALGVAYLPLKELLAQSDIVSLHLASNADTYHFMDQAKFALMKPDAILINTARGEVVSQPDLVAALVNGEIGGAGLDCLDPEPVQPDNELLHLPAAVAHKVTLAPHIGGVTAEAFRFMHATVWSNIRAVAKGRKPINIVNGVE